MPAIRSTKEFVEKLRKEGELFVFQEEIDPVLELAEVQRRVVAKKGPALLFTKAQGTQFPIATNLYGSEKRIHLAFGEKPIQTIARLAKLAKEILPPRLQRLWKERDLAFLPFQVGLKQISKPPLSYGTKVNIQDTELPEFVSWQEDGGPFVTLPLVYTEHPKHGTGNLGMYRVQLYRDKTVGMHIQIHRGGGFHYYEAEKENKSLPAHVYIGGPPAMTIAAIAPLPEEIPELVFASFLMGERLRITRDTKISPLPLVADADFAIIGKIPPHKRKLEGPFGDHYGYYSLAHEYPYLEIDKILHRKDAIWAATVVGRPPQEDHYIAEFLQDLLSPLFPLVMPQVLGVWAYEESGVHSLAAAIVKERYYKESFMGALRILGEGQLSLTKVLLVTDQPVILKNFSETFKTIVERCDLQRDIHLFQNISQDTLDYTSGTVNKGSKLLILGVGDKKKKDLPTSFSGKLMDPKLQNPRVYLPGVLVVEGKSFEQEKHLAEALLIEKDIQSFPFVFLVDDSFDATKSDHDFIWTIFTKMEPARDLYSQSTLVQNRAVFGKSLVFDCRQKPWMPKVLEPDTKVVEAVDRKFGKILDKL